MVTFTAWAEDSEGTEWPTLVIWEGSPRTHTVEEEHCKIVPWPPQLCTTCHTTKCKPRTESSSWLCDSYEDWELAASLGENFLLLPSKPRLPRRGHYFNGSAALKNSSSIWTHLQFPWLRGGTILGIHLSPQVLQAVSPNDTEKVEWGWDTLNFLKIWIIA